ncbi:hypothetical protein BBJ28_00013699 [Nothophytophthora sp. Chile5]|nr:hypothetical protein BBJ28_00013699 [Nothophytophthora sp. Chile5]
MDALAAADPLAPSEARVTPVVGATRRRGHRAQSDVWRHLTAEPSPHQRTSSRCMHCQQRIPHHRKSEKARAHLNRCAPFRRQMTQLAPTARPSWVDLAVRPRGRVVESDRDPDPLPIVPAPPAAVQPEPTLPTATEHLPTNDSVQMALASHCYVTGVPLTTMTGPHLAAAFAASGSTITVELPTAEDLTGPLLQRTLAAVHERIDVQMASCSFTALACNSWWRRDGGDDDDDVELRVHYSVVTEGRVLLLETARPSVVQWQDATHEMAELERVIERCHRSICGT